MSTYPFPAGLEPHSVGFGYSAVDKVFSSPLNGHMQTGSRPGSSLALEMIWEKLTEDLRQELEGFLAKLNGRQHYTTIAPVVWRPQRGTLVGTPLVDGAGQTGTSLVTDGWGADQTVLKRGDLCGLGAELKIAADDAVANSSGQATLNLRPGIRIAPANNAPIEVINPEGVFRLAQPAWSMQVLGMPNPRFGAISISFVEVVSQS